MWRERAGTVFDCEKTPVTASRGMVVTNHPLASLGHPVVAVDHVAGGMAAIDFRGDGAMTGAACWRADGTPLGIGGGLARKGVHFFTDPRGLAARATAKS